MIKVINFQHPKIVDSNVEVVNTTSRSVNWSRGLSPFFLGPIPLYDGHVSKNMENAWQYSKFYEYYAESDGSVGERYFNWAKEGWNKSIADRYPMGKDAKPLFSYWDGKHLSYVKARNEIYIPLYSKAVAKTQAFEQLKSMYEDLIKNNKNLYLQDFDAHNLNPGSFEYEYLANNPNIKFGHAYVLAMMLEGKISY